MGLEPLVERLRAVAPSRAATVDLANPRRVVRALEIAEVAGADVPLPDAARLLRAGRLDRARTSTPVAPSRMDRWTGPGPSSTAGLVDEARDLRERFDPGLPAFSRDRLPRGLGADRRPLDRDAAIAEDARRNGAFAKRQRTWFRSEPDIAWLDATAGSVVEPALEVARRLLA